MSKKSSKPESAAMRTARKTMDGLKRLGLTRRRYGPGTFGCHEALDRTSLLSELVYELSEHDAIKLNPKWEAMATKAGGILFDLYQAIGAVHLGCDDPPHQK